LIHPEPGHSFKLFIVGNLTTICTFDNAVAISNFCPLGFYGSDDLNLCFKIVPDALENEEACRFVINKK